MLPDPETYITLDTALDSLQQQLDVAFAIIRDIEERMLTVADLDA